MSNSTEIETLKQPAIIIDTARGEIRAANAPARRLWGLTATADMPIAINPDMPALKHLNEVDINATNDNNDLALVFWTAVGAQHLRCSIRPETDKANVLIVFEHATLDTVAAADASESPEQDAIGSAQKRIPSPMHAPLAQALSPVPLAAGSDRAGVEAASIDMQAMAHELRTPIGAIIALSEMIETEQFGPLGDPRYQEYARDIGDSARLSLGIVASSLEQNADTNHLLQNFTELNLAELIQKCLRTLHQSALQAQVTLRQIVPGDLPHLIASGPGLTQILLNLLTNAVKFTPEGGTVTVEVTATEEGGIKLSVRDTGVGMTMIDTKVLFSDGDQTSTAQKSSSDATAAPPRRGIGFSLVRRLAEAMTARFEISSTRGIGTNVSLTFPPEHVIPMATAQSPQQKVD